MKSQENTYPLDPNPDSATAAYISLAKYFRMTSLRVASPEHLDIGKTGLAFIG